MKRRPKVLFDFEAYSDQSRGGVSRYALELATRLAGEVEVRVAAGFHRNLYARTLRAAWWSGRFVAALPATGRLRRRVNAALTRREIRRFAPDIVHRTYHRLGAAYPGAHREVLTLYDFTYFRFPECFEGGAAVRRAMHAAATHAHGWICISETTRRDAAVFLPGLSRPCSVIPLGVYPASDDSNSRTSPSARPFLLHVGQRGGYKDFSLTVEALARTPRLAPLSLIAFGGGPLTRNERRMLQRSGLASRVVQMHGDDSALASAYRQAAALVYPSRYEGFGLPLLEAMVRGCPVVASDAPALRETGGDAVEYFASGDPEALGHAIIRAVLEDARRESLRERGPLRAALFTWDACARSTLEVYERLIDLPS